MPLEKIGARSARDDRKRSRRCSSLCGVIIIAVLLVDAASARAGTYTMHNCDVPGQPNTPMHPWEALDNGLQGITTTDNCASGAGVALSLPESQQLPVGANASIIIKRPDGPRSQIQFVKVMLWYAARLVGSGSPINVTTYLYDPHYTVTEGVSNSPPGSEHLVAEQQLASDTVYYYVGIYCGQLTMPRPSDPCVVANRVPR